MGYRTELYEKGILCTVPFPHVLLYRTVLRARFWSCMIMMMEHNRGGLHVRTHVHVYMD